MMQDNNNALPQNCTSVKLDITIDESCIDNMLTELQMDIPINEQYTLTNLKVNLEEGKIVFAAGLKEKPGTTVIVTTSPEWDESTQRIIFRDLNFKTDSNNLLLKSAGWLAQTFLQSRIDRKLEDQANVMFGKQIAKLKEKPLKIPLPKGGHAQVMIAELLIHQLIFAPQTVDVTATILGSWRLHLQAVTT